MVVHVLPFSRSWQRFVLSHLQSRSFALVACDHRIWHITHNWHATQPAQQGIRLCTCMHRFMYVMRTNCFCWAAVARYGHATATDIILRLTSDWTEHPKGNLVLMQTYYNPNVVLEAGLEPLIRGFIALPQGAVEARWAET